MEKSSIQGNSAIAESDICKLGNNSILSPCLLLNCLSLRICRKQVKRAQIMSKPNKRSSVSATHLARLSHSRISEWINNKSDDYEEEEEEEEEEEDDDDDNDDHIDACKDQENNKYKDRVAFRLAVWILYYHNHVQSNSISPLSLKNPHPQAQTMNTLSTRRMQAKLRWEYLIRCLWTAAGPPAFMRSCLHEFLHLCKKYCSISARKRGHTLKRESGITSTKHVQENSRNYKYKKIIQTKHHFWSR